MSHPAAPPRARRIPAGLDLRATPWRERPIVAFDGMRLPLALLPDLPAVMPLLAHAMAAEGDNGGGADVEAEG